MDKINKEIKNKIYSLRRKNGISQETMAAYLNISLNSYRKLERGSTKLVSDKLIDIADVLKVNSKNLLLVDGMSKRYKQGENNEDNLIEDIEAENVEIWNIKDYTLEKELIQKALLQLEEIRDTLDTVSKHIEKKK